MAKVDMRAKMPIAPDTLWKTIGGFNALPAWHPAVEKSDVTRGDEKGSVRTLSLAGGGTVTERLDESDAKQRRYRYSILSGPLPVADYSAEVEVEDNGDGTSTLHWSSEFQPKGASEADAVGVIRGVYQAGIDNLKKMFA